MSDQGIHDAGLATRAIHACEATDPHTRAHATPIYQTATYAFAAAEDKERPSTGR